MKSKALIIAILSFVSMTANAQRVGGYAGTELVHSRVQKAGSSMGYGVFAGYRFGNGVAVEASANRIGRYELVSGADRVAFSLNDFNVSGLFGIPVSDSVSVYGRLGYGSMRVSEKNRLASRGFKVDNGAIYGVGLSYQASQSVDVRAEFRKPASDVSSFGLGVSFAF